ncbi:hypothetical protein BDZ91DRAFT_718199 [Kalaharituber pfeilii]|nr:hypothetical protein BDZ91DRAFT_718199 [Kalaharituber pfeilii]
MSHQNIPSFLFFLGEGVFALNTTVPFSVLSLVRLTIVLLQLPHHIPPQIYIPPPLSL